MRDRVTVSLVSLVIMLTVNLAGAQDIVRTASPSPQPPMPDPMRDSSLPPRPVRAPAPRLPASSVIEIRSSVDQLKEDKHLLSIINAELEEVITATPRNYERVAIDASDIRRLATRLLRNLSERRSGEEEAPANPGASPSNDPLDTMIVALAAAVKKVLGHPALTEARALDAKSISEVGADLERIVEQSTKVQTRAEALVSKAEDGKRSSSRSSPALRSRLPERASIQLGLECDAWSIDKVLARPARTKGVSSIDLGVKVRMTSHKLAEQLILPIQGCVDADADERSRANHMRYVAVVKDFSSFDVRGEVFAYQVSYQIAFTENAGSVKRIEGAQPVWFYFIAADGAGNFDLFRGVVGIDLVPEWAREMARKR